MKHSNKGKKGVKESSKFFANRSVNNCAQKNEELPPIFIFNFHNKILNNNKKVLPNKNIFKRIVNDRYKINFM